MAADAELRRLIRGGFEQGISGEVLLSLLSLLSPTATPQKLAEAAGLSVPWMYQIRDGRR
jgi:hypothetical protein